MTPYEQRKVDEATADRLIIEDAGANGFMACRAIRDALGWDKPEPNGSYYGSMGVAYRWIVDGGEEVVYLIPNGPTNVTKSERTGCWSPTCSPAYWPYKEAHTTPGSDTPNGTTPSARPLAAR